MKYDHADLTRKILGVAMVIHRTLGPGFLESIYEKAMALELERQGIPFKRQLKMPIHYLGEVVGEHRLDMLVDGRVIVELKTVKELSPVHMAIALSYLKAANVDVALIINFAKPSLAWRRVYRSGKRTT